MVSVTRGGRDGFPLAQRSHHHARLTTASFATNHQHLVVRERANFLAVFFWDFADSTSLLTASSFGQPDPRNLIRQISP
jgi:hypothetical protein